MAPTDQQRHDLRLNGWKNSRGIQSGPKFFDWFKEQVIFSYTSTLVLFQQFELW